jgi:8-oxo-dGTP pyrophosphatase MutT (NUDIX family)
MNRTRSDDYSLSVYAIIRRGGKTLLTQDLYRPGWKLPGGGVETGELILEALKREVREEVGLDIRPRKLLLMANWLKKGTSLGRLRLYFVADSIRGAIALGRDEVAQARWFSRRELQALNEEEYLYPQHYGEAIRYYLRADRRDAAFREIPATRGAGSKTGKGGWHVVS